MDDKDILVRNLKRLSQANGCELNASKFTNFLNGFETENFIDKSYVSRVFKNSPTNPVNLSFDKLSKIASVLGVELWQLLHPMGFNDEGRSLASTSTLDKSLLLEAVTYANDAAQELKINDSKFITEIIELAYFNKVSGDNKDFGIQLAKISRKYF